MLLTPVARLQLDECDDTGAYYYLTFKRNPKERYLLKFLDEEGKLSALKMLQELREIIKQEVKNIEGKYLREQASPRSAKNPVTLPCC